MPTVERDPLFTFASVLNLFLRLVFGIIEFLVIMRFFFKLFGANPANAIVAWLYDMSYPLVAPFIGMFPIPDIPGRFTLELASLIALLVYAFAAYLLSELIAYIAYISNRRL